ncbi:hypothetical protein DVH05_004897 [Phytophthora capsici]|nr:hypothetical protein DVH05_004897 [Phytophthora capsici]
MKLGIFTSVTAYGNTKADQAIYKALAKTNVSADMNQLSQLVDRFCSSETTGLLYQI